MEIREALEQLVQNGHTVEQRPVFTGGMVFYHVAGMPRGRGLKIAIGDGLRECPKPLIAIFIPS